MEVGGISMKYNMAFNVRFDIPERNSGVSITERAGYVPAKVQIENLLNAGQRLLSYRQGLYDFEPGQEVDDDFEDPTRAPNYDLADASRDAQVASEGMKRSKHKAEAEKAAREAADKARSDADAKKPETV